MMGAGLESPHCVWGSSRLAALDSLWQPQSVVVLRAKQRCQHTQHTLLCIGVYRSPGADTETVSGSLCSQEQGP